MDPTLYAEPSQQDQQAALAATLKRLGMVNQPPIPLAPEQPPQAPQQVQGDPQRGAALYAMLSGNKGLEQSGQAAAFGIPQAQQGLQAGGLQNQKIAQEIQQSGPQAALGGMSPNVAEAKAKLNTSQAALTNWDHVVNPDTGDVWVVNRKTGEARLLGGSGGQQQPGSLERVGKLGQAFIDKFKADLDPNAFRSGVLKGNQERANAADRLLKLAVDPITGGPANLNPQQMTELSSSLASLLSGGGAGSEGQRMELTPHTKGRSFAQIMQWLTDEPQGAEQQAFVKQMIDTANREKGVVSDQILKAQVSRIPAHLRVLQSYPENAKAILSGFGIDPSTIDFKTGKYTPKTAPPPPPSSNRQGPVQIGSDADYNALPSGTEFIGPDGKHRRKP